MGILIYGFINSAILALLAMGFNLTFGISGVANFAYGAIYVFTGFLVWILINSFALGYWISVLISLCLAFLVGIFIFYAVIRRIKGMALSEVIATFGVGIAGMELFRYFGFIGSKYSLPPIFVGNVSVGHVTVDLQRIMIGVMAVLLTLFVYLFTRHTKIGLAFRAIAQDERTALTFGINSDKTVALSMGFGSALGAASAILILPLGNITVEGGYDVLLNALAVCIVGGLGSSVGIMVASGLIGYAQTATAFFLETHWMMLVSLIAIIMILTAKPSGLFSQQKELEERV
ncbi:MAG: branched-chain amino acid ABC transporter permease [Desulfatiglandales bacterium]